MKTRSNLLVLAATALLVVAVSWAAWAGNPVTFTTLVDMLIFAAPGVPQVIAVPLTVLVAAPAIGIFLDRVIMRHLQGKELVVQLTVTIGLMFAFIGLANMIWDQNVSHTLPQLFGEGGIDIAGVTLTWARLFTIGVGVGGHEPRRGRAGVADRRLVPGSP